jgi:hypothetical protein
MRAELQQYLRSSYSGEMNIRKNGPDVLWLSEPTEFALVRTEQQLRHSAMPRVVF